MRDKQGRFVKGHRAIPPRDNHGKFTKNLMETTDRHSMAVQEVEELFRKKGLNK